MRCRGRNPLLRVTRATASTHAKKQMKVAEQWGSTPEERMRMGRAKIVTALRTKRTDGSQQGYDTAVRMYIYFIMALKGREEGDISLVLTADTETLMMFYVSRLEKGTKFSSIVTARAAIKAVFTDHGMESPTDDDAVVRVYEALKAECKRDQGAQMRAATAPLSSARKLADHVTETLLRGEDMEDLRDLVTCLTGMTTLARGGALGRVRAGDIAWHDKAKPWKGLEVALRDEKGRRGETIVKKCEGSVVDRVLGQGTYAAAMAIYVTACRIPRQEEIWTMSEDTTTENPYVFTKEGMEALERRELDAIVKRFLGILGVEEGASTHSLRRTSAEWWRLMGETTEELMKRGHWRSQSGMRPYMQGKMLTSEQAGENIREARLPEPVMSWSSHQLVQMCTRWRAVAKRKGWGWA